MTTLLLRISEYIAALRNIDSSIAQADIAYKKLTNLPDDEPRDHDTILQLLTDINRWQAEKVAVSLQLAQFVYERQPEVPYKNQQLVQLIYRVGRNVGHRGWWGIGTIAKIVHSRQISVMWDDTFTNYYEVQFESDGGEIFETRVLPGAVFRLYEGETFYKVKHGFTNEEMSGFFVGDKTPYVIEGQVLRLDMARHLNHQRGNDDYPDRTNPKDAIPLFVRLTGIDPDYEEIWWANPDDVELITNLEALDHES